MQKLFVSLRAQPSSIPAARGREALVCSHTLARHKKSHDPAGSQCILIWSCEFSSYRRAYSRSTPEGTERKGNVQFIGGNFFRSAVPERICTGPATTWHAERLGNPCSTCRIMRRSHAVACVFSYSTDQLCCCYGPIAASASCRWRCKRSAVMRGCGRGKTTYTAGTGAEHVRWTT